jgi:hypothetical protein
MATRNSFPAQTALQMKRESDALRHIAVHLGSAETWEGASDYLEAIAGIIGGAGLPDPGDADSIAFYTGAVR